MTKECPIDCTPAARDCAFGAWSEWSSCHAGDTQMVRQRMVEENPAFGGKPCMGPMKETKACGLLVVDSPCRFSDWSAWNECSETCDGGSQTRFRRITTRAAGHGALCDESLEELHTCHTQACPSNKTNCQFGGWGEWSECGVFGSNQRSRARTIAKDSDGGAPCSGHLEEIESCGFDIVDCDISEWTHWDKCGKTCGGGQQHRQRQVHQFPMNGGKNCPVDLMQTRGCNELPCGGQDCEVSDWGDWLPCTAKCGVGQEIRHRTVTKNRMLGGVGCKMQLSQTLPCSGNPACNKTDCKWSDWSDWGNCTVSCGGGQRTRDRHIAQAPEHHGAVCSVKDSVEITPCRTKVCEPPPCKDGKWEQWGNWSVCSASCLGGVTFRTRSIESTPNWCGKAVEGDDRQVQFCNANIACRPPVDCSFGFWGAWSSCSATCNGIKVRKRRISQYGRDAGTFCVGGLEELSPCYPSPGMTTPVGCREEAPVDCVLDDWESWTECSATCGGGQRVRTRHIGKLPRHGGKACEDPLKEVSECARQPCAGPRAVDCTLGDWREWGACSKCGGQRKRWKRVISMPQHGGKNCEAFDQEMTEPCRRTCHKPTWCTWSDWMSWGSCTASCGKSRRSRRRWLKSTDAPAQPPQEVQELVARFAMLSKQVQALEVHGSMHLMFAFFLGSLTFALGLGTYRVLGPRRRQDDAVSSSAEDSQNESREHHLYSRMQLSTTDE